MNRPNQDLIDRMTNELTPVRRMKAGTGLALALAALLVTIVLIALLDGLRHGLTSGDVSPYFLITNGLLLVLGVACSISAVSMASPRVGSHHDGPKWAMAMLAMVPLAAFVSLVTRGSLAPATSDPYGPYCFLSAMAASALVGLSLFGWLKRGAPVSSARAGLHAGVAAGAFGAFAYGLACPFDGIVHLGLFHVTPVLLSGLLGRFAVPPLLRW